MTRNQIKSVVRAGSQCRVDLNRVESTDWNKVLVERAEYGLLVRLFDIFVAVVALLLAFPVMAAAAAAIMVESRGRGSVLYFQTRVGCDGKTFRVIKFRTMRMDAEKSGAQWASQNDPRVTRVGRFLRDTRIDELPQFFNVLQGSMSVVGPRPERPEFVSELSREIPHYDARHFVKPGITGWAQVHYPYGASKEDSRNKLEYDLFYLLNRNLFLDLLVTLKTVRVCMFGVGAR